MNVADPSIFQAFSRKDYAAVIHLFERNHKLQSCDPSVGLCYANALRHSAQLKKAGKAFNILLKRFPNVLPLLNSFGNFQIVQKRLPEAITIFKKALSIDGNFIDALINLARAQSLSGQYTEAVKSYELALKKKPNNTNVLLGLAECSAKASALNKAEAYYQRLLPWAMQTQQVKPFIGYANVLFLSNRIGEAIKVLSEARTFAHKDKSLCLSLAQYYMLDDQFDAAEQCYLEAIALSPYDPEVQVNFAQFAWSVGKKSPFKALMTSVNSEHADQLLINASLDLLLNAEQFELANEIIQRRQTMSAKDPYFHMFSARYYRLANKLEKAQEQIELARKGSPSPTPSTIENESGYIALAAANVKRALTTYKTLQKREPNDQGWWTLYSTALKLSSRWSEYAALCRYDLVMTKAIQSDKSNDFMQCLSSTLIEMHTTSRHPIGQSLRNGTQTFNDIFDDSTPVIQELKEWILEKATSLLRELTTNRHHPFLKHVEQQPTFNASWSVSLSEGGFHNSHFHPKGWLSGVFYIDVPQAVNEGGEGWLEFGRPEIQQLDVEADYFVKPTNGLLVLFPSFMWHGTRPFSTGKRRLTIAFDMVPVTK